MKDDPHVGRGRLLHRLHLNPANRDRLVAALSERGVRPVRRIAVEDTWSAPRFRPAN
ncbi:hypothetical protein ACWERI_13730 [Streptomyces collinus]